MVGIYIHIPFCRKACHYCNFHFSTSLKYTRRMVDALCRELVLRREEATGQQVSTLYFGGGTPSVLSREELGLLMEAVQRHYDLAADAEITLEANPDDMTEAWLRDALTLGINRLSVGVQSFRPEDLLLMNRSHDAPTALKALATARRLGFASLSADLIYGTPGMDDAAFRQNIVTLLGFGPDHISAYSLTVEPRTALAHQVRVGQVAAPDEEQSVRQFYLLRQALADAGYEHYEISNWALPGRYARHNTAYWQGKSYLGIGPSAHSFDGVRRAWNVAMNAQYMQAIEEGRLPREEEQLTPADHYNELVMTRLRTMWGLREEAIPSAYAAHFAGAAQSLLERGELVYRQGGYYLAEEALVFADRIAAALFAENA
jgi:oxygen-independent coproporphyrinogen-3 oxidase